MSVVFSGSITEVITLADAKAHLRVDYDAADTVIEDLIETAREWAEEHTNQQFAVRTATEIAGGFCCDTCTILLGSFPVTAVTKVEYIAEADAATRTYTEVPNTDYFLRSENGLYYLQLHHGAEWPTTADVPDALRYTYTVGFGASTPKTVRRAMLLMIAFWYENPEDIAINERNNPRVRSAEYLLSKHRIAWIS